MYKSENNDFKTRIGVYDSRAVAEIYWASENRLDRYHQSLTRKIKEAKKSGDNKYVGKLCSELKAHRKLVHLQIFGTQPLGHILDDIKDKLSIVAKEANVIAILSKWDKKSYRCYKSYECVDVTNLLIKQFTPQEEVFRTAQELMQRCPIPNRILKIMLFFRNF